MLVIDSWSDHERETDGTGLLKSGIIHFYYLSSSIPDNLSFFQLFEKSRTGTRYKDNIYEKILSHEVDMGNFHV